MTKIKRAMLAAIKRAILEGAKAGDGRNHPDATTFLEKSGRGWEIIESFIDRIGSEYDSRSLFNICLNELIEAHGMKWDDLWRTAQNKEVLNHGGDKYTNDNVLMILEKALAKGLDKDEVIYRVQRQAEMELSSQLIERGHKDISLDNFSLVFEYCADVSICEGKVKASEWHNSVDEIDWLAERLDEGLRAELLTTDEMEGE